MATLVNARCARAVLRMRKLLHEIGCALDGSLWDVITLMLGDRRELTEVRFLLGLAQKLPLLIELPDDVVGRFRGCEPAVPAGAIGEPLVLCAHVGAIAVSFPIDVVWDVDQLTIYFDEIGQDDSISRAEKTIDNVARVHHAMSILRRERLAIRGQLTQANVWAMRDRAFPCLCFGLDVEAHLVGVGAAGFGAILTRLGELDEASREWKNENIARPNYRSKVSDESDATKSQYKAERTFRDSFGTRQVYWLHARFGGAGRIHFREISKTIVTVSSTKSARS
jgi:hypothetical protein